MTRCVITKAVNYSSDWFGYKVGSTLSREIDRVERIFHNPNFHNRRQITPNSRVLGVYSGTPGWGGVGVPQFKNGTKPNFQPNRGYQNRPLELNGRSSWQILARVIWLLPFRMKWHPRLMHRITDLNPERSQSSS
ncbi:hypothetical protein AVEN_60910-1 [Araneus ventricosus]|uniref:Uncharacterized protein n=1 Tax=Araneus ventricosus TaxID=182803 RepID=A0A4Y2KPV2_ARAVE|nr:hypothetical protein AVEN_60910-1 [Araneus ventricosus]